jgi:hypothetical protein
VSRAASSRHGQGVHVAQEEEGQEGEGGGSTFSRASVSDSLVADTSAVTRFKDSESQA